MVNFTDIPKLQENIDDNCSGSSQHRLYQILGQPRPAAAPSHERFDFHEPGCPWKRARLSIFVRTPSTDQLSINDETQSGSALARVSDFLDILREMSGRPVFADVRSTSNFPASAGIASSAAAFAALAVAGARAYGLELNERDLSRLARRGFGFRLPLHSEPASLNGSPAATIAIPMRSPSPLLSTGSLWDCIAVVESGPKLTGLHRRTRPGAHFPAAKRPRRGRVTPFGDLPSSHPGQGFR